MPQFDETTERLPILSSAWAALSSPFSSPLVFAELAWAPFGLILLSQFGAGLLEGLSRSRLLTLLTIPPYAVFSAIFSVAWVRFLLFGTGPAGWKNFEF